MTEVLAGFSRELEALVARFHGLLRLAASRQGLAADAFDDLVQETRIRLWRAGARGEKISTLPASYLYRTAATAAIDLLRRDRARREDALDETGTVAAAPAHAADAETARRDVEQVVAEAVDRLGDNRRSVVRMYLAGYSREEIAMHLGWTDAKVRNLLYRGLDDLRTDLRARGIDPRTESEGT